MPKALVSFSFLTNDNGNYYKLQLYSLYFTVLPLFPVHSDGQTLSICSSTLWLLVKDPCRTFLPLEEKAM